MVTHGVVVPRAWLFAVLALLAPAASGLALWGCAGIASGSYVNSQTGLTPYATVGWGPADGVPTGDPRLDNNPFFEKRLQTDVAQRLGERGFQQAGEPDLLVYYHVSVGERIDGFGYCDAGGCEPFVYDFGTIVLDLVDRRVNRLVWRGWASGSMDGAIDNQDWMERRIDEAVTRIMARLPANSNASR